MPVRINGVILLLQYDKQWGLAFQNYRKIQISARAILITVSMHHTLGTLRYEDGKARTGTAVDAGNFRGSRCVAKNKMLKMCLFAKDGDVNNSNFVKAIHISNDIL